MIFALYFLISQVIVDIAVKGNRNVDKSLIISTSGISIGDELNSRNINQAIKRLYNVGFFEDVYINQETEGDGTRLIIYVSECRVLESVTFSGNKKFKKKKLLKISELQEGNIVSSKAIFDAKQKIKTAYEKKGYYLVNVIDKRREQDGKLYLKIIVEEGGHVKVKWIEIMGNKHFKDRKIKSKMKSKDKVPWWKFWGKKTFDEEEFKEDRQRIISFYQKKGFPNCKIEDIRVIPDKEKKGVNIYIKINEGKRLYTGIVNFEGNKVISTEILMKNVEFQTKKPYNKEKQDKTLRKFYELYGDKGYMYVVIEAREDIRDSLVDITYKITEGEPARLRKIIIAGNAKTHEKVIRREFTLFPGDILKRNELIRTQRKVFNLGFFKDIKIDTRKVTDKGDSAEGDIDLILIVEEKQTGQINMGVGYSQDYGISGNLAVSVPNFRGRGELVYVKWEKGAKIQNIEAGFNEPWLFDTPTSVGLDLYHNTLRRDYYSYKRKGGTIHTGRSIPHLVYTKGFVSYKLEEVGVDIEDPTKVGTAILEQEGYKIRSSIEFKLVRDSRDNFLNATTGSRNSIQSEFSGGIFGGEVDYHKYILSSSFYERLFWKFVLMIGGKVGFVDGYTSSTTVPIYERFTPGGTGYWGLRGYRDRSIGPMSGDEVMGGRFALIYTVELKLAFEQNIYPLLFFDCGNTWETFTTSNITDLKRGAGIGIRIEIPMMGMLGFDFGYGFDKPSPGWEPHFQIGRTF